MLAGNLDGAGRNPQRLDPAMGTQFFLATCYENTRRPTSAWSLFLEVAAAAKAAGKTVGGSTARARAAALEPKLPRLRVTLDEATAATPGLEVERDGVALKRVAWGVPIPVDLGNHTLRVRATRRPSRRCRPPPRSSRRRRSSSPRRPPPGSLGSGPRPS